MLRAGLQVCFQQKEERIGIDEPKFVAIVGLPSVLHRLFMPGGRFEDRPHHEKLGQVAANEPGNPRPRFRRFAVQVDLHPGVGHA